MILALPNTAEFPAPGCGSLLLGRYAGGLLTKMVGLLRNADTRSYDGHLEGDSGITVDAVETRKIPASPESVF